MSTSESKVPLVIDARTRAWAERYLAESGEYTTPGEAEKLMNDWAGKRKEAENVARDFERRAGPLRGKRILDVGCGNGVFMAVFAKAGATVAGLEVNRTLVEIAREVLKDEGAEGQMLEYDGTTFPFPDASFDYVLSVGVLEHVSDPRLILRETARVLIPGGRCYLSFPNRWRPLETHTQHLFIGYLPRPFARLVLTRFWNLDTVDDLNLHFLSFWSLKRFLRGTLLSVVPEYTATTGMRHLLKRVLGFFGIHPSAILGMVMVVLEKRA